MLNHMHSNTDILMLQASDIYSFGVLLYELCSGQQAWEGFGFYQVIYKVTVEGRHPEMHRYMPRQLKVRSQATINQDFAVSHLLVFG